MQIGSEMAALQEKTPKMDPKKRFFWKIPQDFELLKKVPQNIHQTGQFGWYRYIGIWNLSHGAFQGDVRTIPYACSLQIWHHSNWFAHKVSLTMNCVRPTFYYKWDFLCRRHAVETRLIIVNCSRILAQWVWLVKRKTVSLLPSVRFEALHVADI